MADAKVMKALRAAIRSQADALNQLARDLSEETLSRGAGCELHAIAESVWKAGDVANSIGGRDNPTGGGLGRGLAIAGVVAGLSILGAALVSRPLPADPFAAGSTVAGAGRRRVTVIGRK